MASIPERARPRHDPFRHQGLLVEDERTEDGRIARVATVFLTGRECPWRCVMCDLWKHTIETDTPAGAIPQQLDLAFAEVRRREGAVPAVVKLYNAGSFFDARAVPQADYAGVAARLRGVARVVVESHPALVGARLDRFLRALRPNGPQLEVAMGLETAHPQALARIDKGMTLDQFRSAADALLARDVALRVFLLAPPPFVPAAEQEEWLLRSIDFALGCGASVVSLVPTRTGNPPLDAFAAEGFFARPVLSDLERLFTAALAHAGGRGRVFLDLWDLERFHDGGGEIDERRERLHRMNLEQRAIA